MLIQCHQLTIKNVMLRKQSASAPYGRVVSEALHVTPQGGTIDVFRAYYDAARTSHAAQQAPHYQFANLKNFEDVVMFLQCFGFQGVREARENRISF
jgi:hypothetical protein